MIDHFESTRTLAGMEMLALAESIASHAHADQKDKAGLSYIGHPARVARILLVRVPGEYGQALAAAGWLHDVLEDTPCTAEFLYDNGLPALVVQAVEALTRTSGQTKSQYYSGIRANPIALAVKLADIEDNTDPRRLTMLDDETQIRLIRKYAEALNFLID